METMAGGTRNAGSGSNTANGDRQRPPDFIFIIQAESVGRRLDVFLNQQYPALSRSHFKRLIEDRQVLLNQHPTKPASELKIGDQVAVWLPVLAPDQQLTPQLIPLDILYEDDDLLAVNKASGMVVHPGAGHREGTLVHALLAHCSKLAIQGSPLRPGIVHRLDQDTSGVLVVAKSEVAYLDLIRQFKAHSVTKEYLALVYGRVTLARGEIITHMDRHPTDRKKMAVVQGRGREAISRWEVAKRWEDVTLLRVRIETGRTHQIRVHLSHLHHPVVGDAVYGGGKRRAKAVKSTLLQPILTATERQMLHAWRLAIDHPITHQRLNFEAPPPHDFASLIAAIEGNARAETVADV
jgi:23S rRNA pseudouridine1911/1915/1917 synthase